MFDHRMLGIPSRAGKPLVELRLPLGWGRDSGVPSRVADVGAPVLTHVTVYSAAEAAAINARYREQAERTLREKIAAQGPDYPTRHLEELALQTAAQVDHLLEAIRADGYFSSWVLVESATID
ncbi:MAG TPA: hypothetical protein VHG08_04815 [Longimicrobium sp.]|nr:hypothetical protein [Longimicrobium sp.]